MKDFWTAWTGRNHWGLAFAVAFTIVLAVMTGQPLWLILIGTAVLLDLGGTAASVSRTRRE